MNEMSYNNFESQTQDKKTLIDQLFNEECDKIRDRVLRVSDAFYCDLQSSIPQWIKGAQCSTKISNIFKAKSQATDFTSQLVRICSDKIKYKTTEWVNKHFIPMLMSEINALAQTMSSKTSTYEQELANLRVSMDIDQQGIVKNATPSRTNRALSAGASLLVGDVGGAIMGGAGGLDATLKTIGCEVGAGVILGVISVFTPVGLTAMVVGVVLSALVGSKWSLSTMEDKIRKKVSEKMVDSIKSTGNKEKFNKAIINNVNRSLEELRNNVETDWSVLRCA